MSRISSDGECPITELNEIEKGERRGGIGVKRGKAIIGANENGKNIARFSSFLGKHLLLRARVGI